MIYDINKFVTVENIADGVFVLCEKNADDPGYLWMYLVVGSRAALLIDTSFGVGDLSGLCGEISGGKPLIVVNTHAHPDHSFGNCRFDSVYCHPNAIPELESQSARMWDRMLDERGNGIWMKFTRADLPKFRKYEIKGCPDGTIFDLGGVEIETIFTPGHDSGHISLLDRAHRLLFAGDCISDEDIHVEGPWRGQLCLEDSTLAAYLDSLRRLEAHADLFDKLLPSHGSWQMTSHGGVDFEVSQDFSLGLEDLRAVIRACEAIISAPNSFDMSEPCAGGERRFKHIEGLGRLVYRVHDRDFSQI